MRRDGVLLAEIVEAGARSLALVADRSSADFDNDPDRRDALLWNFTVLGEAVGQLSDEIKNDHPEITWSSPVRMRNRIVHGYWSIDLDILVTTAHDDLSDLLDAVRGVLTADPDSVDPT